MYRHRRGGLGRPDLNITAMPKIRIVDSFGLGYAVGKEYEVDSVTAKQLIDAGKAIALEADKPEKTSATKTKIEKR